MENIDFIIKVDNETKRGYMKIVLPFEIDKMWEISINKAIQLFFGTCLRSMGPSIKEQDLWIDGYNTLKTREFPCSNMKYVEKELEEFKSDFLKMIDSALVIYKSLLNAE